MKLLFAVFLILGAIFILRKLRYVIKYKLEYPKKLKLVKQAVRLINGQTGLYKYGEIDNGRYVSHELKEDVFNWKISVNAHTHGVGWTVELTIMEEDAKPKSTAWRSMLHQAFDALSELKDQNITVLVNACSKGQHSTVENYLASLDE